MLVNQKLRLFLYVFFILFTDSIEWPKSYFPIDDDCVNAKIKRCLLYYKGLYMMSIDSNKVFGNLIVPFLKSALIGAFIISFFASVIFFRTANGFSALGFSVTSYICISCIIFLTPFSNTISGLFDISAQRFRNIYPKIQLVADKKTKQILNRELRSCATVCCQVGGLYHMEAVSKLTMLGGMVNGVAFLLINMKT